MDARDPHRCYSGVFEQGGRDAMSHRVVLVEHGRPAPLPPRLDVCNHSPDGLAWGYGGSGPAQCALAVLCDAVGPERALPLYQGFKRDQIARFDQREVWSLTLAEVLAWVEGAEASRR